MISFIIERHIVRLPDVEKFIPQTSDVGPGPWSGTGCWRRGGAWAGPYSPPPHHFHFRCHPLMVQTHSETEGQRWRGPEHPPTARKQEIQEKERGARMDEKEEDAEEQTTTERRETKDGRIKECEWGGKRRQEEGIGRKGKKEKSKPWKSIQVF